MDGDYVVRVRHSPSNSAGCAADIHTNLTSTLGTVPREHNTPDMYDCLGLVSLIGDAHELLYHCRHQSLRAVGEHAFVSRDTFLSDPCGGI